MALLARRNGVERFFRRPTRFRRFAALYDKLDVAFRSFVRLAVTWEAPQLP